MRTIGRLSGAIAALSLGWWPAAHADVVTDWNEITVKCVQGSSEFAGKRSGPAGLLDIALVQAAVHDAVQAIQGRFEPYEYENRALRGRGTPAAAAASAAYGMLTGLYGADTACLQNVTDPKVTYPNDPALKAGTEAAAALLPLYRPTMTLPTDPFLGSEAPGQWRPTPGVTQGAGTFLAVTAPFSMKHPAQFRPGRPPKLNSWRYTLDYYEVKAVGAASSTVRKPEQTDLAYFWTANFFAQMNEALRGVAKDRLKDVGDSARMFALTAFAAADSQISVYDAKYHYNFWRPITAIQHGNNDRNPLTVGDVSWTPLVATPAYPENSSGANCLAAAITTVLQRFFNSDKVKISFTTTNPNVMVNPRTYQRLSDVQRDMIGARIYQGIHFRTSEEVGRRQGMRIGEWTYAKYLKPVRRKNKK